MGDGSGAFKVGDVGSKNPKLTIHFFHGEDTWGARVALDQLARDQQARLRWLEPEDLATKTLQQWCEENGSNLFGREIMVLRDVSGWPSAAQQAMYETLEEPAGQGQVVIWQRESVPANHPLTRRFKKQAKGFTYDRQAIIQWLITETEQAGGKINPAAAAILVDRLGSDRWRLQAEVHKLILQQTEITEATARQCEAVTQEEGTIFQAIGAMTTPGQLRQAITLVEGLLSQGHSEFYILSMISYQLRTLLAIGYGAGQGWAAEEISRQASLPLFVVRQRLGSIKNFPRGRLVGMLVKVLATDMALKQGKTDPRTGLLLLVLGFGSSR